MSTTETIKRELIELIGYDVKECGALLAYVEVLTKSSGMAVVAVLGNMLGKEVRSTSNGSETFVYLSKHQELHSDTLARFAGLRVEKETELNNNNNNNNNI